jgi:hypothetical protein
MALHTFRFSYRRRARTALYPLGLAVVLGVVHLLFVRPGSWVSLALLAAVALLLIRAVQWMWGGRHPVQMDDQGMLRDGPRIPWAGAMLHLRARHAGAGALRLDEAIVYSAADAKGLRTGISFDVSLERFDEAVKVLLAHVPDERVKVWAPGGKVLEGEPREALLSAYRPALDQVLAGRPGALGRPPVSLRPPE